MGAWREARPPMCTDGNLSWEILGAWQLADKRTSCNALYRHVNLRHTHRKSPKKSEALAPRARKNRFKKILSEVAQKLKMFCRLEFFL